MKKTDLSRKIHQYCNHNDVIDPISLTNTIWDFLSGYTQEAEYVVNFDDNDIDSTPVIVIEE